MIIKKITEKMEVLKKFIVTLSQIFMRNVLFKNIEACLRQIRLKYIRIKKIYILQAMLNI